ncbi:hypothetical protein DVR12_23720 [Chitinophaga silvatica]|uniref:Uncharacterized protein n=1 Tax=Chitinophaga silvatica TaxID=2282649 RepID=A0A3E1Y3M7_9BACT|nr:hypothetical protein [Chitinophaga silvatica]RFS19246.1 hypothetical protein DVR12_23720 [Chitinophaga silvatica]
MENNVKQASSGTCNIKINNIGRIPTAPASVSSEDQMSAFNLITQLSFQDIWKIPPFQLQEGTTTIFVENPLYDSGRAWLIKNAQNQVIVYTVVAGTLSTASTADQQANVLQMVRNGLTDSLNTSCMIDVNGICN